MIRCARGRKTSKSGEIYFLFSNRFQSTERGIQMVILVAVMIVRCNSVHVRPIAIFMKLKTGVPMGH